jgi:flavin reductase (DIM6/NTAB) family NADH-FMN oxidoreductase RutF
MNTSALFKIGYGLYVLTANEQGKDNGCIVNTVMQITSEPLQVVVCVNKNNYTCGMIQHTRKFNISVLTEETGFDVFKNFGYQSGQNTDKFTNFVDVKRTNNGILYITKNTNAYFSAWVQQEIDLGTHIMFIAQLIEAEVLSNKPTVTYDFYQKNIKPKPEKTEKKGWRCKICGYVYEAEDLPADFICPICKHGAVDFEKI